MTIKLKFFNYLFVLVCLIMGTGMSVHAEEQTFTRINSIEELNDSDRFIVVNEQFKAAPSEWSGTKYFKYTTLDLSEGKAIARDKVATFTLEKAGSYYYLKTTEDGKYFSNNSRSRDEYASALRNTPDETSRAKIEFKDQFVIIRFDQKEKRALLFSSGAGFSCYSYNFIDLSDRRIVLYKADGSQSAIKRSTFVTFSSNDLTIYKGKEFSLPTASVTLRNGEAIADAKLSYSSSNEKVASVGESTGEITLKEFGTTTITAKYAGSDLYKESEGSYTLTYQDRLGEATIVFSAENEAFYNMPTSADNQVPLKDYIFKADNGKEYTFGTYSLYKHRINKGFLTSLAGGGRLSSPDFLAPNGYAVRVIFEQSHKVTKPYILNHEVPNYINNGPGEITDFTDAERLLSHAVLLL